MSIIHRVLLIIGLSMASVHLFAMDYNKLFDSTDKKLNKPTQDLFKAIKRLNVVDLKELKECLKIINDLIKNGADLQAIKVGRLTKVKQTPSGFAEQLGLNLLATALKDRSAWDSAYAPEYEKEFLNSLFDEIEQRQANRMKKSGVDIFFEYSSAEFKESNVSNNRIDIKKSTESIFDDRICNSIGISKSQKPIKIKNDSEDKRKSKEFTKRKRSKSTTPIHTTPNKLKKKVSKDKDPVVGRKALPKEEKKSKSKTPGSSPITNRKNSKAKESNPLTKSVGGGKNNNKPKRLSFAPDYKVIVTPQITKAPKKDSSEEDLF